MIFPKLSVPTLALAAAAVASVAAAANAGRTAAPADDTSAIPQYRSAFDGYRAFRDEPLVSWQESNRAVGALGGHMGHLRGDARQAAPGPRR